MSSKNQQSDNAVVMGNRHVSVPKNLIDAVSQIQQYYTLESNGTSIPADFLTLEGAIDLWGIGFKTSVKNNLFSAIMSPLMVGVFYKYIPIFGNFNPNFFDTIWVIILNYSLTICYTIFLSFIARYYIGSITKSAIRNLFYGIITGVIITTIVIFVFFHSLYFLFLTDKNIVSVLLSIKSFISIEALNKIYLWTMEFKKVFLVASWAIVLNAIIILFIPSGFMIFKARKVNAEIENREKWQIGAQ